MLLENVPLTQFPGHTSYGQTKIQLHLWNYKTSYKQLLVPLGYFCDGLNIFHLGSNLNCNLLSKLHSLCTGYHLIQKWNLVWFTKFQHLHRVTLKKTNLYWIFFATSSRYPRNTLKSMPMKFQNINPMSTLSTLTNTLTMIKTFALDLDTIAYNECSILPSIGFLIYPILLNPLTLPSYKLHH